MAADESAPTQSDRYGYSVRAHLAIYTVALVTPVLLFAAFLFWQVAATERARIEGDASDGSRSVAAALDRELAGLFASVDVLAMSADLQSADFEAFHRQAAALDRRQNITMILTDMSGQQVVNSQQSWGSALPRTNVPFDRAALQTGRPFVTDLYRGAVTGTPVFAIVTSVMKEGQPAYVLIFALDLDRLTRLLQDGDIPQNATASIVDRNGIVMAHNNNPKIVGRQASRDFMESAGGRRGSWTGTTLDGVGVFATYARSALSDYRVAVGIRTSDLNAPLWRSIGLFAALGLVILALSTVLSLVFGQRITLPIKALAQRAAALGRGEVVTPLTTGLAEANQVGAQLAAASTSLRERESDLREANDEVQRFAYIVSHDLRSPLVNIMGFTTELEALRQDMFERLGQLRLAVDDRTDTLNDRRLGEDFDEAIAFIKTSTTKMDRLINAILKLSREGRRDFKPERVDMDAMLAGIRASLAHQADQADAKVTISRLPAVTSDRLALEQIFSNLVDNALKYLRPGVPGRIEVEGHASAAELTYRVRDNGRGVDARDRERIFELFRRSGVQDRAGEGIGLAHVRALVRRLGGTISLTSELGQGSTFTVSFPRAWAGEAQRKAA